MSDIVNKDNMFCDQYRALSLLEYPKELALVRQLIELVELAVEKNKSDNIWSHMHILIEITAGLTKLTLILLLTVCAS